MAHSQDGSAPTAPDHRTSTLSRCRRVSPPWPARTVRAGVISALRPADRRLYMSMGTPGTMALKCEATGAARRVPGEAAVAEALSHSQADGCKAIRLVQHDRGSTLP